MSGAPMDIDASAAGATSSSPAPVASGSDGKLKAVELYGGHFAARVPVSFIDISTVRQVPNHQEFYADTSSGFNVIFEINEMQKVENSKCIEYFFNDLAKGNDAKATRVHSKGTPEIPSFKNEFTAYIVGDHVVNQRVDSRGPEMTVRVHLAAIRIPKVTTDILIVMGMPVKSELTKQVADKLKNTFLDVVTSFQIKNWAIFGPQAKP